ncbi:NACHT domain-containing protein [Streptomyces sp. NPDC003635]
MSTFRKVMIGAVVAAAGPYVAVATGFLQEHPVAAAFILLAYYLIAALVGITGKIWSKLLDIWLARIVAFLDIRLQQATSRHRRLYLRFVRNAHAHMDLKGLTTRGDYALSVNEVFVPLSLDPNSLHSLSSNIVDYGGDGPQFWQSIMDERAASLTPLGALSYTFQLAGRVTGRLIKSPRGWRKGAVNQATLAFLDGSDVSFYAPKSIWGWLRTSRNSNSVLVIVGPPGSGKTTLLKHVAITMAIWKRAARSAIGSQKIPVLIELRHHKDKFADRDWAPLLPDIIRSSIGDLQRREPPNWIEAQLEKGRMIVMLDGLDEVATGEVRLNVSDWVERQRVTYPDVDFIVTSRPFGYQSAPLNSATVVQVQPFTERQVGDFIERWYSSTAMRSYAGDRGAAELYAQSSSRELLDRLYESSALLSLTVNPLLLTMIATVHHYRGALPGTRIELYKEICEVLLGKRHQARGVETDLEISALQKQSVLQFLAFRMMEHRVRDIGRYEACSLISEPLSRVAPDVPPTEFLKHVEQSSGLLLEQERDAYAFAHLTFQEFLAANYIREERMEGILVANLRDSWWRETTLLYASQSDATEIVEACLREADDLASLSLAVQCSEEGREVSLSARRALSEFVAGEVRMEPNRRKAAGAVRLFQRSRGFLRFAEDEYVSVTPITCLEYQLYIDESGRLESSIPDHWTDRVYPSGAESSPVMGVRPAEAQAFCEWVERTYSDQWSYDLLDVDQIRNAELAAKLNFIGVGVVTVKSLTTGVVSFYPVSEFNPDPAILHAQLDADARATIFSGSAAGQHVLEDAGLEVALLLTRERLAALCDAKSKARANLVAAWDHVEAVDLSSVRAAAESLGQAIRSFAYDEASSATAALTASLRTELGAVIQALEYAVAVSYSQSAVAPVKPNIHDMERLCSRWLCLSAAQICRSLADSVSSIVTGQELRGRTMRSRLSISWPRQRVGGAPRASSLTRRASSETYESLAQDFELMYCLLATLESRIAGQSEPWEGFFLARRRRGRGGQIFVGGDGNVDLSFLQGHIPG